MRFIRWSGFVLNLNGIVGESDEIERTLCRRSRCRTATDLCPMRGRILKRSGRSLLAAMWKHGLQEPSEAARRRTGPVSFCRALLTGG